MSKTDRSWAAQDVLWELGASFIDAATDTAAPVIDGAITRVASLLNALSMGVWTMDNATMTGRAAYSWSVDEWAETGDGFLATPDPAVRDAVVEGGGLAVVELEMVVGADLCVERGWGGGYALVALIHMDAAESLVLVVASADNDWDEQDLELIHGMVLLLRQFQSRLRVEEELHQRLRLDDLIVELASRFQGASAENIDDIVRSALAELRAVMTLESVVLIDVIDDTTIEIPAMVGKADLPPEFRRLPLPEISSIPGAEDLTLRQYIAEPRVVDLVEMVDALLGPESTDAFDLRDRARTVALLPASIGHGDSLLAIVRLGEGDGNEREFDALSTLASLIAQTRGRVAAERASEELLDAQRALVTTGKIFLEAEGADASDAIGATLERMAAHMGADLAVIATIGSARCCAELHLGDRRGPAPRGCTRARRCYG